MTETKYYLADINELIPYARNARTHSETQIAQIAASIKEFGFLSPIIVSKDNTILAGHGRFYAAQKLGLKKIPCIKEEHLTEAQKKAYIIADNKLSLNAGWDDELLQVELSDLKADDFDLSLLGFNDQELEKLLSGNQDTREDDFDIEEELKKPVFSKLGDLWTLGRHTLLCGDSTKEEDVKRLCKDKTIDLYLTDSPYNVAIGEKGKTYKKPSAKKTLSKSYGCTDRSILNDDMSDEDFKNFLVKAFQNADRTLKDGAVIYLFHADSEGYNFRFACKEAGWQVRQCLIWKKNALVIGRQDYQWIHEPILYMWKNGSSHAWYSDRKQTTVLEYPRPQKNKEHPTMKPINLLGYLIKNSSKEGDFVLDFFAGSGSTLIACEELNRSCFTIELDPKYVDVVVNRYRELVGSDKDIKCLREDKEYSYSEIFKDKDDGKD